MAKIADRHFLSLIFLSLFVSPAMCRNISPRVSGSTASLDVAASLDKATRALSFDPHRAAQTIEQDSKEAAARATGGAASLSLQLHSRDFLPIPTSAAAHEDYRALTLARLRRDSARVQAIQARVALALKGVKRSDLKPIANGNFKAEAAVNGYFITAPIVSGTNQGSGEYLSASRFDA